MNVELKVELAKEAIRSRKWLYVTNALIIIAGLVLACYAKFIAKDESSAVSIMIVAWFLTPSFDDLDDIINFDKKEDEDE